MISAVNLRGYKLASYANENYSNIKNAREILSRQEYTGQKAKAFDQFDNAISKFHSIVFSPIAKMQLGIAVIVGLMALISAILLIARKGVGVKLGLITLTLVLAWNLYGSFAAESFRKEIIAIYTTMYESVSIIASKKVAFSPELQQAARPELVESLCYCGLQLCLLALFFLRRQTIIAKIIQPSGSGYRPPAAGSA